METPQGHLGQPIVNIVGEKVALGPLRRDLLPLYHKWSNDFEGMECLATEFERLAPRRVLPDAQGMPCGSQEGR